jgi:hypothetical protein
LSNGLQRPQLTLIFLIGLGCLACEAQEQNQAVALRSSPTIRISGFRVERDGSNAGALFVSIDGSETRVADRALNAWIIDRGREIVYSGPDGAGGYENEGQSLRLYAPDTGESRKILSEYFAVERVQEVATKSGKRVLLVEMRDSGLGAWHVAVVGPDRGEVFAARKVRLLGRHNDVITIGYYRDEDWEAMIQGKNVSPFKTERHSLNRLLNGRVIVNKQAP